MFREINAKDVASLSKRSNKNRGPVVDVVAFEDKARQDNGIQKVATSETTGLSPSNSSSSENVKSYPDLDIILSVSEDECMRIWYAETPSTTGSVTRVKKFVFPDDNTESDECSDSENAMHVANMKVESSNSKTVATASNTTNHDDKIPVKGRTPQKPRPHIMRHLAAHLQKKSKKHVF